MTSESATNGGARITVSWGYDSHSIELDSEQWNRVLGGEPLSIEGEGYCYEESFFQDYWMFGGGLDGKLEVSYGDGGGQGFVGSLRDANIEVQEP